MAFSLLLRSKITSLSCKDISNMAIHVTIANVTSRIAERSRPYRTAYLHRLDAANHQGVQRGALSCTNLAHGFAAFPASDKLLLKQDKSLSVAIVSAYNDML